MNNPYITSEQIIGSYAVKYNKLVELVNNNYRNRNDTNINIYIDLGNIFKSISRFSYINIDPFSITASIINLCAHYRHFFSEYYKCTSKIFIILSDTTDNGINNRFVPEYCNNIYSNNSEMNNTLKESLNYINMITKYIEDMILLVTNFEFGVIAYDIINKEALNNNKANLIISKDIYNLQLVSDNMEDDIRVELLYPKKNNGQDLSFIISSINLYNFFFEKRKVSIDYNILKPSLISLIMSLSRTPERNIKSLYKIPNVINSINELVSRGLIMNTHSIDILYICNLLSKLKLINIKDPEQILMRFNSIDIISQYTMYCEIIHISDRYNGITNLYDPEAVKEINNKYFKKYPLDLNVL